MSATSTPSLAFPFGRLVRGDAIVVALAFRPAAVSFNAKDCPVSVLRATRRSRLRLDLLHEASGDQLGRDFCAAPPFSFGGIARIPPSRRAAALSIRSCESGKSGGHGLCSLRVCTGPANLGPSLTRAPDRHDRQGEGSAGRPRRPSTPTHTLSSEPNASPFSALWRGKVTEASKSANQFQVSVACAKAEVDLAPAVVGKDQELSRICPHVDRQRLLAACPLGNAT